MSYLKFFSAIGIGKQEQKQLEQPSLVGYIICSFTKASARFQSTGLLLSADLVLTTASSVYSKSRQRKFQLISFFLPSTDGGTPFKEYKVNQCRFPSQYITNNSTQYDYALLKLNQKITMPQYYSLEVFKEGEGFQLIGFTQNAEPERPFTRKSIFIDKLTIKAEEYYYSIQNEPGITGAPITRKGNKSQTNNPIVVAIHRGRFQHSTSSVSIGVPISIQMIHNLKHWQKTFQFISSLQVIDGPQFLQMNKGMGCQTQLTDNTPPKQSEAQQGKDSYKQRYYKVCEQIESNQEELSQWRWQRQRNYLEINQLVSLFKEYYVEEEKCQEIQKLLLSYHKSKSNTLK